MSRPLRVLHGPLNFAGGAGNLNAGMKKIGVESELWIYHEQPFIRGCDRNLNRRQGGGAKTLALELPKMSKVFAEAASRFDVFHYHTPNTFLPKRFELPALRRLGKGLVVQFWGSDIRDKPPEAVDYLMRHVDAGIIGSVATMRRAPRADGWAPYHLLPQAIDSDAWPETPPNPGKVIRIVHAPSRRRSKGTEHVLDAIATLKAEGAPVELDLIENTPNAEARKRYQAADLVIDQLKVGWYGMLCTESLSLGKPVICRLDADAAAAQEEILGVKIPIVRADAESLADVIRGLVKEPERLVEIGRQSRVYVEQVHECAAVARRCLDLYRAAGIRVDR